MVIKYTPYRGKLEPVTKVHKSDIKFFPEHVEIIYCYEYEPYGSDGGSDTIQAAYLVPRYAISIMRSATYHIDDPQRELCPLVVVDVAGVPDSITLHCKTNKEADEIYENFKDYLLGV